MRKTLLLYCSLFLLIFMSACAGASSVSQQSFTLTFNSAYPASSFDWDPKGLAVERFAELVEERTNGQVKFELYFSNQLVSQAESLLALQNQTIDLQNIASSAWADQVPEGLMSMLPMTRISEEHLLHIMNETEFGELFKEALAEKGVIPLSYWVASPTAILSSTPIDSIEDMNGLVFNVDNSLMNDFYKKVGAGIANVPIVEQYEGMLRGTIDAFSMPYYTLDTFKYHEVVDYASIPTINPSFGMIAISKKTWDTLPENLQTIIAETAKEMEQAGIESSKRLTDVGFEAMNKNGVQLVKMSEDNYNTFKETIQQTVWEKFGSISDRTAKMTEVLYKENEEAYLKEKYSEDFENFYELYIE